MSVIGTKRTWQRSWLLAAGGKQSVLAWLAFDLRQLVWTCRFGLGARPMGQFDGQSLGRFRRHLAKDIRYPARIDLGRYVDEDLHVEAIENARRVFRLHVL